jgi:hypothetical protein
MSDTQDPYARFNTLVKLAAVATVLMTAYYVWSFFVSSRYQALCGGSYWELSRKQIDSCLERERELQK